MRILSLLPAATDMVVALGAEAELVGITHECAEPPGAHQRRPRVTASMIADGTAADVDAQVRDRSARGDPLYTLDDVRIRALQPDVVLTQAVCDVCAVREDDVRALAATMQPVPAVVPLSASTLDGVLAEIEVIARALHRPDRGTALVASLRTRLRAVHDRLRAAAAPRPNVAVVEWTDPLFVAGHWVPDMIRRAGGRDALAQPGDHSIVTTLDRIVATDPAVVLIAPCGYDSQRAAATAAALLDQPAWQWARRRTVWALDANVLTSRPGPHLVRGVEVLASILHPTLFPAPAPADALPVNGQARDRARPTPLPSC